MKPHLEHKIVSGSPPIALGRIASGKKVVDRLAVLCGAMLDDVFPDQTTSMSIHVDQYIGLELKGSHCSCWSRRG